MASRRRVLKMLVVPLAIVLLVGAGLWLFVPIRTEAWIEQHLPWIERLPKQPYVQNPSPTAITIVYEADTPGQGTVRYTTGRHFDQTAPAELFQKIQHDKGATYLYRARIESLRPATQYKYRVVHEPQGQSPARSRIAWFQTWPDGPEPITFIAYGDSRTSPETHAVIAHQFEPYHPAFILHTGDAIGSADPYDQWEVQFFEPLEATIGETPIFFARGNHDGSAEDMLRWFETPGGRTWYSFTCGPVHVAVLDCYVNTSEFRDWLDRDLAQSQAPWKIVMYHEPTFDFGGHLSHWGRDLLPIFAKHRVDVVLAGHSHLYERFVPLRLTGSSDHATTFITTGGGGAGLYPIAPHPLLVKAESTHHYCVFEADSNRLAMRALTPRGQEIDRFTITKAGGQSDEYAPPPAKPVEAAIMAQGIIEAETGAAPADPAPAKSVDTPGHRP